MQTLVNVGIGVYYHLNKAYITQKLCENRNNPKLHCNGHCYLTKQLKKAEESERKQAQNILKEKEDILTALQSLKTINYLPAFSVISLFNFASQNRGIDATDCLLKPPAA